MRPLLVHSSSKSQISAPRRVLHIEYTVSQVVVPGLELAAGAAGEIESERPANAFEQPVTPFPTVYNRYLPG